MNIQISFLMLCSFFASVEAMDVFSFGATEMAAVRVVIEPVDAPYLPTEVGQVPAALHSVHTPRLSIIIRPITVRPLVSQVWHSSAAPSDERMVVDNAEQLAPGYPPFSALPYDVVHSASASRVTASGIVSPGLTHQELEAVLAIAGMNKVRHGMKKIRVNSLTERGLNFSSESDSDSDQSYRVELVPHRKMPPFDKREWNITELHGTLKLVCKFCDINVNDVAGASSHSFSDKHLMKANRELLWDEKTYQCASCKFGTFVKTNMKTHLNSLGHRQVRKAARAGANGTLLALKI